MNRRHFLDDYSKRVAQDLRALDRADERLRLRLFLFAIGIFIGGIVGGLMLLVPIFRWF